MDRYERTANLIRSFYEFKRNKDNAIFVKEVCTYFDEIINDEFTGADLNFLSIIANEAGIPHFYDMFLEKRVSDNHNIISNVSMGMLGAYFYDASLSVDENNKLHRFQKDIVSKFVVNQSNRYVLTAPTSFGKTFLVYQILHKMNYKNVLLIFPTISLLTENYEKINNNPYFNKYKLHTLSEAEFSEDDFNIFVFTPERYLSFLDVNRKLQIDFTFIDEIYKIDNGYLIDDEVAENERDVAYRLALEYACRNSKDLFLAGPYISIDKDCNTNSFIRFCEEKNFNILVFNQYEIVNKSYHEITERGKYEIDGIHINIPNKQKKTLIKNIVCAVSTPLENTIVYCGRKIDAERYPGYILNDTDALAGFIQMYNEQPDEIYEMFLEHLEQYYGSDWIVVLALKARIGIHHGLIPKYIQKEIINLFNRGQLLCLFSTTTITEGVNTPAKNIVITSLKKGKKELKQFDAKNIAGRAGRFGKHYSGRIIDISKGFEDIIDGDREKLKHKNYDLDMPKSDVDFQITEEKYLSRDEMELKNTIRIRESQLNLPSDVMSRFKVVGPQKKLDLYERMLKMDDVETLLVKELINSVIISRGTTFNWQGMQVILNIIEPIVSDAKLKSMINNKSITKNGDEFSILIYLLSAYLKDGFMGMVKYKKEIKNLTIDNAMRQVADNIYNTFKYQLVKYLGTFDILYRYMIAQQKSCEIDDISGLAILLQKLEYNATNEKAKIVSDYGVPFRLVSKYENPNGKIELDRYEQYIDSQITKLFKE